jgi:hypothetical protein
VVSFIDLTKKEKLMHPLKNLKDSMSIFLNGVRLNFSTFGYIEPAFICFIEGKLKIFALIWEKPEDKDTFAAMIQSLIASNAINEYVMIVEAWIARTDMNGYSNVREWLGQHGSLSNFPNRDEAVMIQYCSSKEEVQYLAKINRSGEKPTLENWQESKNSSAMSLLELSTRFQGLFPKSKAESN